MTYGVTSTGFVMPTLLEIIDDMSTTAKELFGSNVDVEVWSSLGMFIRTIAADNLLVWQGQQDLYYVPYLDFAYGRHLDDLLAMFAFSRRIAARATGYVAFTGTLGTFIPGSTIIKTADDDPISFKTVDPLTITEMVTNGEFTADTASWTAEDNAVLASVAPSPYTLDFTSGGAYEVLVGNTLTGATSGATAVVSEIILSGGTWAGADAAGTFYFSSQVGTFVAENLNDAVGGADVCTIAGDSTPVDCSGNCLRITCGASDNPYAEQQISVDEYLFYDLSLLVRQGTEATYRVIVYDVTNSADIYNSSDDATNDWSASITERVEIPAGCTTVAIQLKQIAPTGSADTIFFDTVSFTKVGTNIIAIDAALASNVPIDNIIILESPISGIVSVTNPNATNGGRNKEIDAVYRARYKLSTMGVGKATLNAIVSSVLAVSTVSSATIEENDTAIDYTNQLLNSGFDSNMSHWYGGNAATISSIPKKLDFTSGGTHEVLVADTLIGHVSGAMAVVAAIVLSGGTWGGGDAAGTFYFSTQSGVFVAENIDDGVNINVCDVAGDSSDAGKSGNCLMVLGTGTDDPYGYQIKHVTPAEEYILTVYIVAGNEATYLVDVGDNDNGGVIAAATCTGEEVIGDWSTSCVETFTIPAGCYSIEIRFGQDEVASTKEMFFDSSLLHLDPVGLPPHSVRVSVQGGTDNNIAQALLDSVAGGIQAYGDESGTGALDNGQMFDRYFVRPLVVTITITADIESDATYEGNAAVETAIIDYIGGTDTDDTVYAGLGVGDDVLFYEIVSAIMGVTGVTNVSNLSVNGVSVDITIDTNEVAKTSPGDITLSP